MRTVPELAAIQPSASDLNHLPSPFAEALALVEPQDPHPLALLAYAETSELAFEHAARRAFPAACSAFIASISAAIRCSPRETALGLGDLQL